MLFRYYTKKLSKEKLEIFKQLFKMWCQDNNIKRYEVCNNTSFTRLSMAFNEPQDVMLFKIANPSMWNQIDLSYADNALQAWPDIIRR